MQDTRGTCLMDTQDAACVSVEGQAGRWAGRAVDGHSEGCEHPIR